MLFTAPWHTAMHTKAFKRLGINIKGDLKVLQGNFYFLESDLRRICRAVDWQESRKWFKKFFDICDKKTEELNNFAGDIKRLIVLITDSFSCSLLVELLDLCLENVLKRICEKDGVSFDEIFLAMRPAKKTMLMQYQRELSTLASGNINSFIKKWEWVGTHAFEGEPLTRKRIRQELRIAKRNDTVSYHKYFYDKELDDLIWIGQYLVFYRSNLMENIDRLLFRYHDEFKRLAVKNKMAYFDIVSLTDTEFFDLLERKTVPANVKRRKKSFGFVGIDGVVETLLGSALKRELLIHAGVVRDTNIVYGLVAFKGKVTGRVRVIQRPEDCHDFKEGEILVTAETTPDYIMAMKQAAAFVTNHGGITSHAAIMARELRIPCVIGTKVATKVFKNGELVEVDANEGVVRKLK